MAFSEAQQFFESALEHVDARRDPMMWNLVNGLIKLAQSSQHLQHDVTHAKREVDKVAADVRRIKHQ